MPPATVVARTDIPRPIPLQHKAREGLEPEEGRDAPEGGAGSGREVIESEGVHLRCGESVQPKTQLRLVYGLTNNTSVEAASHCYALVPYFWRKPLDHSGDARERCTTSTCAEWLAAVHTASE